MNHDRIEKAVTLAAPRARVWRAISDAREFGAWFGLELDGPFVAGEAALGRIAPTRADPEVAKLQEPHRGLPVRLLIERIEPMERFAFRWHPFAIDPARDYAAEPTTLVTFTLADADGGTRLTIAETGFAALPPDRREAAFAANDGGWAHQLRLVAAWLVREP